MQAIAKRIRDQIQPACYTKCVKDTDAATEIVEPECTVEEDPPGNDNTVAASTSACATPSGYVIDPNTDDYSMPAAGVNVCYALLTDDDDGDRLDRRRHVAVLHRRELQPRVQDRAAPGFPAAGGTSISATCSLADFPDVTCPGIGG